MELFEILSEATKPEIKTHDNAILMMEVELKSLKKSISEKEPVVPYDDLRLIDEVEDAIKIIKARDELKVYCCKFLSLTK